MMKMFGCDRSCSLLLFFEFSELDSLEDLFNTLLEELNLHGLDTLMIIYKVIVYGSITLDAIENASLENAFSAWAFLN